MRVTSVVLVMLYCLFPTGCLTANAQQIGRANPTGLTVEASVHTHPLSDEQVSKLALKSVVELTILGDDGAVAKTGSGFVVAPGLIVTNFHVISGAHVVNANYSDGRSVQTYGLATFNQDHDLALVAANTTGIPSLPLGSSQDVQVGEHVVAVGEPQGLTGTVTTGIISSIRVVDGSKVFQTSAPISPGSSGGPLLDEYGQVIGVTSFFFKDGQNLNFAYASGHVAALVASAGPSPAITSWAKEEQLASNTPTTTTPSTTPADDTTYKFTDKPLAGLPGVYVTVDDLNKAATDNGLKADDLKTQIEVRLRTKNVPVFDDAKANADAGDLDLSTLVLDDGNGILSGLIHINVSEEVLLSRTPPVWTNAYTWENFEITTCGPKVLTAYIGQTLTEIVDSFAADYTAQNPPK